MRMKHAPSGHRTVRSRRATNLSLDAALLDEARALGVNLSRACEQGLAEHVAQARADAWLVENEAALSGSNAYAEVSGLPLASARLF